MSPTRLRLALSVGLAAATLTAYLPLFDNGFVNFDDDHYIRHNPALKPGLTPDSVRWAFTTGYGANWFPLTWLSWLLDVTLFGLDPRGFHATSLALHAANVVLLFLLLARATGQPWPSAFVAGTLGLHPLHVESVAWAAARKDVLSGLFWLLATTAYLRHAERPRARSLALVAVLLALGLMSKPVLVTLPFALLLLDAWPLRRLPIERWDGARLRALVAEKLPLVALVAAASVVTFAVQRRAGAVASAEALPLGARALNACVSYVLYLRDAFWPASLAPYYPHPGESLPVALALASGALLVALTALAFVKRAAAPFAFVGWLFYLGTLVPVIGLVQVGEQARADRYSYLPLAGIAIAIAWTLRSLPLDGRALRAVGALSLAAAGLITWWQVRVWHDSATLFEHTLRVTGPNGFAHLNLGIARLETGRVGEAVHELEAAVRLHPGSAEGHAALGEALARAGRHADAATHFELALRLDPTLARVHAAYGRSLALRGDRGSALGHLREAIALDPAAAEPHANLGALLLETAEPGALEHLARAVELAPELVSARANWGRALLRAGRHREAEEQLRAALALGPGDAALLRELATAELGTRDFERALARFTQALRLAPDDGEAHEGAGLALAHLHRFEEAAGHLERASRLRPQDPGPLHAWGMALASAGDMQGAITRYREALSLEPHRPDTLNSLGVALATLGRRDEAERSFRAATKAEPRSAGAWHNLGMALASQGRVTEAERCLLRALELDPAAADAHNNLGVLLARLGRLEEAVRHLREALRLDPSRADARANLARLDSALAADRN